MATSTTTIRVTVGTRDRLAAQARQRGVSVSALLTDLAAQAERHAIFQAERDAEQAEAGDTAARDEAQDWGDATGDGID
jgi:post-segregation antitoxin (ccd killing protein)